MDRKLQIAGLAAVMAVSAVSIALEPKDIPQEPLTEEAAFLQLPIEERARIVMDAVERDNPAAEPVEEAENAKILAAMLEKATRIDDCTITFYTSDTCGKTIYAPDYGITASGMKVVEGLTCATDTRVIPMYSDVFVEWADGTISQYWATDTGVRGNHVDIYVEDYAQAIQGGRQTRTVWFVPPEG